MTKTQITEAIEILFGEVSSEKDVRTLEALLRELADNGPAHRDTILAALAE